MNPSLNFGVLIKKNFMQNPFYYWLQQQQQQQQQQNIWNDDYILNIFFIKGHLTWSTISLQKKYVNMTRRINNGTTTTMKHYTNLPTIRMYNYAYFIRDRKIKKHKK